MPGNKIFVKGAAGSGTFFNIVILLGKRWYVPGKTISTLSRPFYLLLYCVSFLNVINRYALTLNSVLKYFTAVKIA